MRAGIHPARYGIAAKGQNQRRDGVVEFGAAGNGRDFGWLHSHSHFLFPNGALRLRGRAYSTVTINLLKPRKTLFNMRFSSPMWKRLTLRASLVNRARISSLARFGPRHMCGPAPNAM